MRWLRKWLKKSLCGQNGIVAEQMLDFLCGNLLCLPTVVLETLKMFKKTPLCSKKISV
jgi:hypothetical protein